MPSTTLEQQIRDEVAAIAPLDATEEEHRRDVLAWIDSGAQLFRLEKPATPPKHLVSYFAVIDGDNILLVDHKKAQLWLPAGGHVEPGEHPRTTVVRELLEELGFEAEHEIGPPLMVTCTETVGLTAGHHDVSLWYVVRTSRDRPITFDADEFHSVKWFSFSDVPLERSDPHMRRFIHKLSVVTNRDLPKVEVSIAVPRDARLVAEIHVRAWQEAYKDIMSADYLAGLSIDKRESYWSEVIPKGSPELLVARFGDDIVGWVAFDKCRDTDATPSAGEIWAIYVAPDHWSTGVGRALWLQARQKLASDGYQTASLWVLADNAKAIGFYTKAGFVAEPDSAKEFELGGQTLKEVRFVADLVDVGEVV